MNDTMMLIFVDADHRADIAEMLEQCEVDGYTEFPTVLGKGRTGRKRGTRAFPGSSTLYLVAVDDECRPKLIDRLRSLRDAKGDKEGLKVYTMPTEEVL